MLTYYHAIVSGRVQGVSFRYYTRQNARQLDLAGWVYNRPDGTVEVMAEGERDALEKLHRWLHNGPPAATVDTVHTEWSEGEGQFQTFEIKR